jgi:uncharacterized protein (TIGR02679 family)
VSRRHGDRDAPGHAAPRLSHLDRPGLGPLWDELHRRFAKGRAPTTVTLRDLTLDQQRAIADLLGSDRLPGRTARLPVARLVTALHVEDSNALRALVEVHRGPITDRRVARLALRQARQDLWDWLADEVHPLSLPGGVADGAGALAAWVDDVRAAGIPAGDLSAHRARLESVLQVLRSLPRDGASLAGVAADLLGDPHALDPGRAVTRLALDAVADLLGRERPSEAERARLLWEAVGVVPDPLSSTVLVLGLRPPGEQPPTPLTGWLDALADASEPAVMTLAQLRRWPLRPLPAESSAHIVENPSLLAEAAARPWTGPPVVCSSGRPTVAVVTLLRQLGAAGAVLRQHADFDRGGLGITAWLAQRAGTTPWRMTTLNYLTALATDRPRASLSSPLPATPWDPQLGPTMESHAVPVHEEELRTALLTAMEAGS